MSLVLATFFSFQRFDERRDFSVRKKHVFVRVRFYSFIRSGGLLFVTIPSNRRLSVTLMDNFLEKEMKKVGNAVLIRNIQKNMLRVQRVARDI